MANMLTRMHAHENTPRLKSTRIDKAGNEAADEQCYIGATEVDLLIKKMPQPLPTSGL